MRSVMDLTTIAEGLLPSGERWLISVGGSADDYSTFLRVTDARGISHGEGGMGGPLFDPPGHAMSVSTGGGGTGPRHVLVRAVPEIDHVRLRLASGEFLEAFPAAFVPEMDCNVFAL